MFVPRKGPDDILDSNSFPSNSLPLPPPPPQPKANRPRWKSLGSFLGVRFLGQMGDSFEVIEQGSVV